jgi:hypothetical protein
MQTMLTSDDFSFLLTTMNEAIEEIIEKKESKSRRRYITGLKLGSKKCSMHSILAVQSLLCTLPEGTTKVGEELVQLRKLADTVEVRLRLAQEEKEQAIHALQKEQE